MILVIGSTLEESNRRCVKLELLLRNRLLLVDPKKKKSSSNVSLMATSGLPKICNHLEAPRGPT